MQWKTGSTFLPISSDGGTLFRPGNAVLSCHGNLHSGPDRSCQEEDAPGNWNQGTRNRKHVRVIVRLVEVLYVTYQLHGELIA